ARHDGARLPRGAGNLHDVPLEPGTREKHLDASPLSAVTTRTRKFVARHPRKRIVAPLARDEIRALEDASVDDDAAAHTRAENDSEHDARTCGRHVSRYRDRETVSVVCQ